jgi:hypothetical protein
LALFFTWKHSIGHIHLCAGVLSPVVLLKFFGGARAYPSAFTAWTLPIAIDFTNY